MEQRIVDVENVSIKFNLSSEKIYALVISRKKC